MSATHVGAYWGSRRESAQDCAHRLQCLLQRLSVIDRGYEQWFTLGHSKATASEPVRTDTEHLANLLIRGRARRDVNNHTIDPLGFRIDFWNRQDAGIRFGASLGSYSEHQGILNTVVIGLPKYAEAAELYEQVNAVRVVSALIDTMGPSWVTWTTDHWRQAQQERKPAVVHAVGWVTYLGESVTAQNCPGHSDLFSPEDSRVVLAAQDYSTVTDETILDLRRTLIEAGMLH